MSWFQMDSQSVAARVQASGRAAEIPCLGTSLQRGIFGFTAVSVAGFAPWVIWGRWFYMNIGEAGMYAVCALVFIATAGPMMHRLIIGPGSLSRFYKLFSLSFAVYSVLWIVGWMSLRGHVGSMVGLLAGAVAMGWILTRAFDARSETLKVIGALFLLNALGYFVGGWVEAAAASFEGPLSRGRQVMLAKTLWGVCYGIGFGAGLGVAFHLCQARTRALLKSTSATASKLAL